MHSLSFPFVYAALMWALVPSPALWAQSRPNGFDIEGFDIEKRSIARRDIHRGGPGKDGIPAIHRPKFVSVEEADYLEPDDQLLSVEHEGAVRAYPIRILDWHEVVNDAIGDFKFTVTYCPLCGTGMVFDRELEDGAVRFGVSGLLYRSDVLLYDDQTESLWSQLERKAVAGPKTGTELTWVPSRQTTWKLWRKRHPEGRVLSTDTGFRRDYSRSPYAGYEKTSRVMFPVPEHNDAFPNKTWIWGVVLNGEAKAYPEKRLPLNEEVRDEVGNRKLVLTRDEGGVTLKDGDGASIPVVRAFWFAWQAFHPETEIWETPDTP